MAATTMAFVRLLRDLIRDKGFGARIVPIVPGRGAHLRHGLVLPDREDLQPQRPELHLRRPRPVPGLQGVRRRARSCTPASTKPGSIAAFTAAGTSYATHGEPMVPVYVFYSMFGFQRTGDAMWAAMDQMTRGFIIGATAGRTTLTGEGLQHADGHSPVLAATNPAVRIYDPAYGYEIAHIVRAGLDQMYGPDSHRPERHVLPDRLQRAHAAARRTRPPRRRRYRPRPAPDRGRRAKADPAANCSPPACRCHGRSRPHGCSTETGESAPTSGRSPPGPNCAATDSPPKAHLPAPRRRTPDRLRDPKARRHRRPRHRHHRLRLRRPRPDPPVRPQPFATLGTDGHGFSDTRPAARRWFHVDVHSVVVRALQTLADDGLVDAATADQAATRYQLLDVTAGTTGPPR